MLGYYALVLAAIGSFVVALAHGVMVFIGASAYRYFGAGEQMAQMAEQGSLMPALVTTGLAVLFAIWGAYALSGAEIVRPLPLLRPSLVVIGSIYTLRGIALLVELGAQMNLFAWRGEVRPQDPWFSLLSLIIGVVYLVGTVWYKPR